MDNRCWYEAEALFEDLTLCRHVILGSSEEKVEKRGSGVAVRMRWQSWCVRR